jgi:ribonuclease P protein component
MTAAPQTSGLRRLRKRAQFLNAATGQRTGRTAFSLQAIAVGDTEAEAGIGFTVTKKTGNSPQRNRIKRRLRAAVRACGTDFHVQHDYVLVGRRDALTLPFPKIVSDLSSAIAKVHAKPRDPGTARP